MISMLSPIPLLVLFSSIIMQIQCQGQVVFVKYVDHFSPSGFQYFPEPPPQQQQPYQNNQGISNRQSSNSQPSSKEVEEASTVNSFKPPSARKSNYQDVDIDDNQKPQSKQFSGQQPHQHQPLPPTPNFSRKPLSERIKPIFDSNVRPDYISQPPAPLPPQLPPTDNRRVNQPQASQNFGGNIYYNGENTNYNKERPPSNNRKPAPPPPQQQGNYNQNLHFSSGSNQPYQPYQPLNSNAPIPPPTNGGGKPEFISQNGRRPAGQSSYQPNEEISEFKPQDNKVYTDFAWQLFKSSNSPQSPNMVMCPLSPQLLLSYLALGSEGETQNQIKKAIQLSGPKYIQSLVRSMLNEGSNRELQFATAFFVSNNIQLSPAFVSNDAVEIIPADFRNPQKFNSVYNHWASAKTKDQLPAVRFNPDPTTKMIMSSAVYFKGSWIYKFNPASNGEFLTLSGPKPVPMMALKKKMPYGNIADMAEWVSIPYNSSDSMVVILPKPHINCDALIQQIDKSQINRIMESLGNDNYANVNLTLPKFRIETSASLVKPLMQMGISRVFQDNSEINKLTARGEPMHLSNAVQQASLEINEEGSIATSLTSFSVVALSYSPPIPNIEFLVNRPFIAMIVDRTRNFPYFVAKVSNP